MTDTPPEGNQIVPNPPDTSKGIPFPTLILSAIIVGAGIYLVDQLNARAAWALAFLVMLAIAFSYPNFGTELQNILKGATNPEPSQGNRIVPTLPDSNNGTLVGPTGTIEG